MAENRLNRGQGGLRDSVLDRDLCTGCGACVGLCPYFRSHRGKTTTLFPCTLEEGRCFSRCPKVGVDLDDLSRLCFGVPYDGEPLGTVLAVKAAKAGPRMPPVVAQAGGTVSALMYYALGKGHIKGAVATDRRGLLPVPRFLSNPDDVLSCGTSKFAAAPTLSAFNTALADGHTTIGLVGTPCQILAAIRIRAEYAASGNAAAPVGLAVGLFCTWAVDFRRFEPFIAAHMDPARIRKFDIPPPPAEVFRVFGDNGTSLEFSLDTMRGFVLPGCSTCIDMTAEFSDLSVGVFEERPDMNTLLIRTERGEQIVAEAAAAGYLELIDLPERARAHLTEAAAHKKKRALLLAGSRGMIDCDGGTETEPVFLRMNAAVLARLTG